MGGETKSKEKEPYQLRRSRRRLDESEAASLTRATVKESAQKRKTETKSPYFTPKAAPKKRRAPAGTVSCLEFPPTTAKNFGLLQEVLAHEPYQLLIAVQFLNKTKGTHAVPVFLQLMEQYPTPLDLANADHDAVVELIRHLGLQNQRATKIIALARLWIENPPTRGKRYRTLHYPHPDSGRDIKPSEVLDDEDPRDGAWEIAHLPGCGDYAIDSWRIFCRDRLRGLASGYKGEDTFLGDSFEPEWKRVVAKDKELRAFLRWMWLREGYDFDPHTGKKQVATQSLVDRVNNREVVMLQHKELELATKGELSFDNSGMDTTELATLHSNDDPTPKTKKQKMVSNESDDMATPEKRRRSSRISRR